MKAFLSLGSNKGNRTLALKKARELLMRKAGSVLKESSLYETEPYSDNKQAWFLNQCVLVETSLTARGLLEKCHEIEVELGRERNLTVRVSQNGEGVFGIYEPRSIDIDILIYGQHAVRQIGLSVPHLEMHKRRFVLEPLAEIAPNLVHPIFRKEIQEMLDECTDPHGVKKREADILPAKRVAVK